MIPTHVEPVPVNGGDILALLVVLAVLGIVIYLYRRHR